MSRRGAGIALAASAVVVVAAFGWQRSRSGFHAAEARADEARLLAERHALTVSEVLAIHELHGGRETAESLARLVERVADEKASMGATVLAVLATRGRRELALRLRDEARGNPAEAEVRVRATREAVEDGVRFLEVAARYRDRGF